VAAGARLPATRGASDRASQEVQQRRRHGREEADVGVMKVNMRQCARIKVALPKGAHRLFVDARDKARNRQLTIGDATLVK